MLDRINMSDIWSSCNPRIVVLNVKDDESCEKEHLDESPSKDQEKTCHSME